MKHLLPLSKRSYIRIVMEGYKKGWYVPFLLAIVDKTNLCTRADNAVQKVKSGNFVSLHQIFTTIRKNAGLYFPDRGRHQPRIHDLRHTFAVNVLTNWYKSGKNVQDLLPKLSTYLGHLNVSFTSVYLTKTPTLLQEANKLFYAYKNTNNEE